MERNIMDLQEWLDDAVEHRDASVVRFLLDNRAVPKLKHLARAIGDGSIDKVKALLTVSGDPRVEYDYHVALDLAMRCKARRLDVVQKLLSRVDSLNHSVDRRDGFTHLHSAVSTGSNSLVKLLLDYSDDEGWCDPNKKTSTGASPLDLLQKDRPAIVEMLVKRGANPNGSSYRPSPLLTACLSGFLNTAKALLRAGANPNGRGEKFPILIACERGCLETVKALVRAGARLNTFPRRSPLMTACERGFLDVTKTLLRAGADPNGYGGTSPLLIACERGCLETAKVLLGAGADPNDPDKTCPLSIACRKGSIDLAKALLGAGADPYAKDDESFSPLHHAVSEGHYAIAEWLIRDAGVDPTVLEPSSVYRTITNCNFPSRLNAASLLQLGIDPYHRDRDGDTALHILAKGRTNDQNRVSVGQLITSHPGLVNEKNSKGRTPIHDAALFRGTHCLKDLLQAVGADPTAHDLLGMTPLMMAAATGYALRTRELQNAIKGRGLQVNSVDLKGWTALHWCVFAGTLDTATELLKYGSIDANAKTKKGRSPLHFVGANTGWLYRGRQMEDLGEHDIDRLVKHPHRPRFRSHMYTMITQALLDAGASAVVLDDQKNLPFFTAAATSGVGEVYLMLRAAADEGLFDQVNNPPVQRRKAKRKRATPESQYGSNLRRPRSVRFLNHQRL